MISSSQESDEDRLNDGLDKNQEEARKSQCYEYNCNDIRARDEALACADADGTITVINLPLSSLLENLQLNVIVDETTIWTLLGVPKPSEDLEGEWCRFHPTLLPTLNGPEVNVSIQIWKYGPSSLLPPWFLVEFSHSKIPNYEDKYAPRQALEGLFKRDMRKNCCHLFSNFQTYVSHLPYRQTSKKLWQKLCDYPYYARDKDLDAMVRGLERNADYMSARPPVKYAVAPSGFGKTASVAAAFVRSAQSGRQSRFCHYLYMAFENNMHNNYKAIGFVSSDKTTAEYQGADFMLKCVKELLTGKKTGPKTINVSSQPPDIRVTEEALLSFLESKMYTGRILFHIDEHRKMQESADFRRGAMGLLPRLKHVEVIATYIEPPVELSSAYSSEVCRSPIAVPLLDVRTVMKEVNELNFPVEPARMIKSHQRFWATLLFRLGGYLMCHLNMLHMRDDTVFCAFLTDFQKAFVGLDPNDKEAIELALKKCISLCPCELRQSAIIHGCNPLDLLLGMSEMDINEIVDRIGGLVAFSSADDSGIKFTTMVGNLVAIKKPSSEEEVFNAGARLFKAQLGESDLLASTPLERAYLWTLATRSASFKTLYFMEGTNNGFKITCNRIMAGRIFRNTNMESFDLNKAKGLEKGVFYYADEPIGKPSHPFGDIFFRADYDQIVLIDITGTVKSDTSKSKGERLEQWVNYAKQKEEEVSSPSTVSFYGIVLAPLVNANSCRRGDDVFICQGNDAYNLLGGLAQFMAWFPRDT